MVYRFFLEAQSGGEEEETSPFLLFPRSIRKQSKQVVDKDEVDLLFVHRPCHYRGCVPSIRYENESSLHTNAN
jgi:hypothetical protein